MPQREDEFGVRHTYGDEFNRISSMDCCVCGKRGWWAHHVKHVKNGGRDHGNLVPLCLQHHTEIHSIGRLTFGEKYDIVLEEIARSIAD